MIKSLEKVLFLSNQHYLDESRPDGGVKVCTAEFIELLKQKFQVILFPVKIDSTLRFKVKTRLGLGSYDAYNPDSYFVRLKNAIDQNSIKFVFLNLSNSIRFSKVVKKIDNVNVKVILCSHGNESGDFLHEVVRFKSKIPIIKRIFSSLALGRMLQTESYYRLNFIDMVLTVSEVETEIERWLGAKNVFMVPRTIKTHFLNFNPVKNRVGFLGDLSHFPNHNGITLFCDALNKFSHTIDIRIVGGPVKIGEALQKKYSCITYHGYLNNELLEKECTTWCLFLNLLFYYSRGVSTKLAKPLSWGLPVISTTAGRRGYAWKRGTMLIADTPHEMASGVLGNLENDQLHEDAKEIALSMPTLTDIMKDLSPQLEKLH